MGHPHRPPDSLGEARDPLRDKLKDDERRAALRKRILNLAHSRKVTFDKLYQIVLMTIPRNRTTTNGGSSLLSDADANKLQE